MSSIPVGSTRADNSNFRSCCPFLFLLGYHLVDGLNLGTILDLARYFLRCLDGYHFPMQKVINPLFTGLQTSRGQRGDKKFYFSRFGNLKWFYKKSDLVKSFIKCFSGLYGC